MASYGLSLQVLRYVRGGCTGSCVELGADGGKAVVPVEFHSLTVRVQLMAVCWSSDVRLSASAYRCASSYD